MLLPSRSFVPIPPCLTTPSTSVPFIKIWDTWRVHRANRKMPWSGIRGRCSFSKIRSRPYRARAAAWRYLAVAYAGRATMLAALHRDAEMRQDLARMRELDPKPDVEHLRLYRARMLPRPGKPGSPRAAATRGTRSGFGRARNPLPARVHLFAGPSDLSPGDAAALIHDLVGNGSQPQRTQRSQRIPRAKRAYAFSTLLAGHHRRIAPPSSALRAPSPRRGEGDDSPPPTGQASAEPIIGRPRLMGSGMG